MTNRMVNNVAIEERNYSSSVVLGCLETLNQGYEFLDLLSDDDYTFIAQPHVASSIGEHFRHWLDLFHAIRMEPSRIDYNLRRRGHPVERDLSIAKREITELVDWLSHVSSAQVDQSVSVEVETLLSKTQIEQVQSTLARELTFAALHATHHFALAKVVASLRGIQSQQQFGVAPTTVSYQKAQ